MKKCILALCLSLLFILSPYHTIKTLAAETPSGLYAKSALLMDGTSQRILLEKDAQTELPMASTTKIMTCLYALEHGNLNDIVTFSERAAAAPKVHLGAKAGSQFLLSDLLYAMMLESYNDAAVAVAEHIGGSVEAFCAAMTEEARDFGCYQTSFETPNGLDSENHYTTRHDLAIITCRALSNDNFRRIIREPSYTIKEMTGGTAYVLNNKDAFLTSYPGAIGVKTGFTGDAGYCFVGAVESGDRLLISVVLGSGWPPDRSRKWQDTRKLMNYGMEQYENITLSPGEDLPGQLSVLHGQAQICDINIPEDVTLLLRPDEAVSCFADIPQALEAPVRTGDVIGSVTLSIDGETWREYPVTAAASVPRINYSWCFRRLVKEYFFG